MDVAFYWVTWSWAALPKWSLEKIEGSHVASPPCRAKRNGDMRRSTQLYKQENVHII